ncbi:hypothetical protein [uncultured Tateyamaria sp.]|uniref:hypothetical protein n=1 Tax=Tateyamaria sp. 1078 TaxID=3417464 RepID=UPI002625057A|nr:hypothetical protein [uncultured Tateyamaria sp.]
MSKIDYVEFDEFIDVEASLHSALAGLQATSGNPLFWKQVVLCTHAALQGAAVCILTRTNGGGALSKRSETDLLDYFENDREKTTAKKQGTLPPEEMAFPAPKMQNLPGLLRRLPDGLNTDIPQRFDDCASPQIRDLWRLHNWRNEFVHFQVVSWSIEIAGLPRITSGALSLTKEIIASEAYLRRNRFSEGKAADLIDNCLIECQKLEAVTP